MRATCRPVPCSGPCRTRPSTASSWRTDPSSLVHATRTLRPSIGSPLDVERSHGQPGRSRARLDAAPREARRPATRSPAASPDVVGHGPDHVGHVVGRAPDENLVASRPTWVSAVGLTVIERARRRTTPARRTRRTAAVRRTLVSSSGVRFGLRHSGGGIGPAGQGRTSSSYWRCSSLRPAPRTFVWYGMSEVAEEVGQQADLAARLLERRVRGGGVARFPGLDPLAMELDGGGVVLRDPLHGPATDAAVRGRCGRSCGPGLPPPRRCPGRR